MKPHSNERILRTLLVALAILWASGGTAQVRSGPVSGDGGPLSDISTNVGAGSGPVYQRGRSVREGNVGRLGGNPVRGSITGDLSSGPVSDISAGPVTAGQPVTGGGTVTEASAGAVKKDIDAPIRAEISEPLREIGALQEQLRGVHPVPRNAPFSDKQAIGENAFGAAPALAAESELDEPEMGEPDAGEADVGEPDAGAPDTEAAPQEEPGMEEPGEPDTGEQEGERPEVGEQPGNPFEEPQEPNVGSPSGPEEPALGSPMPPEEPGTDVPAPQP